MKWNGNSISHFPHKSTITSLTFAGVAFVLEKKKSSSNWNKNQIVRSQVDVEWRINISVTSRLKKMLRFARFVTSPKAVKSQMRNNIFTLFLFALSKRLRMLSGKILNVGKFFLLSNAASKKKKNILAFKLLRLYLWHRLQVKSFFLSLANFFHSFPLYICRGWRGEGETLVSPDVLRTKKKELFFKELL